VISGALLKNTAQLLFVAGAIILLPMHKDTARAAILLTALPSGFFGVLFGLRYGVESHEAGSTLIVSTILSALTVAILCSGQGYQGANMFDLLADAPAASPVFEAAKFVLDGKDPRQLVREAKQIPLG
jgi:hypothetical protein